MAAYLRGRNEARALGLDLDHGQVLDLGWSLAVRDVPTVTDKAEVQALVQTQRRLLAQVQARDFDVIADRDQALDLGVYPDSVTERHTDQDQTAPKASLSPRFDISDMEPSALHGPGQVDSRARANGETPVWKKKKLAVEDFLAESLDDEQNWS